MTAAETALRTYLENNTEDCSICLADEYAHGHIAFCIRGGYPITSSPAGPATCRQRDT